MTAHSDEQTDLAQSGAPDLAQLGESGGALVGAQSTLRRESPTERRYRLRRLGVIAFAALILAAPALLVWIVISLFNSPAGSAGREFVGDFPIRAHISSEYNNLPGGPPKLRVSALPKLNAESGEWVVAFEETVYEPELLNELYAEFVSPTVAFVIFEQIYAVTTNGGHSWESWNTWDLAPADDSLPGSAGFVIDGVLLDETGAGLLFPLGVQSVDSAWVTDDFGVSWEAPD